MKPVEIKKIELSFKEINFIINEELLRLKKDYGYLIKQEDINERNKVTLMIDSYRKIKQQLNVIFLNFEQQHLKQIINETN